METLVLRPSKFRKKNNTQGDDKNCEEMLSNNIKQEHFEILASWKTDHHCKINFILKKPCAYSNLTQP